MTTFRAYTYDHMLDQIRDWYRQRDVQIAFSAAKILASASDGPHDLYRLAAPLTPDWRGDLLLRGSGECAIVRVSHEDWTDDRLAAGQGYLEPLGEYVCEIRADDWLDPMELVSRDGRYYRRGEPTEV